MSLQMNLCVDGRFDILSVAGSGGMGTVYRARDRQTEQVVALKLLNGRGDRARLEREARLLASLEHPGIVRYLLAGEAAGGRPYLVMEWLAGHDLDERISRAALTVDEALVLASRVAEALAAAHQRGIIHRDLKPANVFLEDGDVSRAKLIDFGLARQEEDVLLTAEGAVIGTPSFMAPEQICGERLDARADVYALGAVVFASLVGRPPFGGSHRIAVLAKAVAEAPPRLKDLLVDVPEGLDAMVARLLMKDRKDRPADAAEVVLELGKVGRASSTRLERSKSITGQEQRVACIVLCDATGTRSDSPDAADDLRLTVVDDRPADGIAEVIEDLGGTLHALTRETTLVTLASAAAPSEQAARAARCALAMATRRPGAPLVVATGRVVMGGSVQMGEVIDRATQTLVGSAQESSTGIVIDAPTAELLGDRFVVRGHGPWRELVAESSEADSSTVRTFLGRAAACVGRTIELATLDAALSECIEEPRSRAAVIIAPPGLGKTRLLQELRARVAQRVGAEGLYAWSDPVRGGSSFGIVGQLLRRRAGIVESDPGPSRAKKLSAMLSSTLSGPDAARLEPFLGELAGVYTAADEAPQQLRAARSDAALMADVMREAWVAWLRALCEAHPLLVALEDIHWADPASIRLLDAALAELADSPLFVVATARPDITTWMPDLWKKRALQEIHLGPLSPKASKTFVLGALGQGADSRTVDAIVERAAGHPFFLEELVRVVASGLGPDALPNSVLGMVQTRLAELDAEARRVLRAASVFGTTFTASGVVALLGTDDELPGVTSALRRLQDREIIVRRSTTRASGEHEQTFRHALLREAAYEMLTDDDRAVAHRLAGEWLAAIGEEDAALVASHFDRGRAPSRALVFYQRAAKAALARSDLDVAAGFIARAIVCGPDDPTRADLDATQSEISYFKGDLDDAIARATAAAPKLSRGSVAWFDAAAAAIGALGQRGRNDEVALWVDRVALADSPDDARGAHVVALCRGFTQLAWAHHPTDLAGVREGLERIARPSDRLGAFEIGWVERVRAEAAWIYDRDVDGCLASFEASTKAFDEAHALRFSCLTRMNHASLAGWAGDTERALELVASARHDSDRFGWKFLSFYALAVTGLVQVFSGDPAAFDTVLSALGPLGSSPRLAFICRVLLGWSAFEAGDLDTADEHALAASEVKVVSELRPAGSALAARVLAARGAHDEALQMALRSVEAHHAARDLELFEGLPDVALAEVHRARGEDHAAKAVLAAAHARLSRIALTIKNEEARARFWRRRLGNDRIALP